jgi:iron complex transport system substrate-binding protein
MRIVSLVPSHTETLFQIGLGKHVVGCTQFCTHPLKETKLIPKVGGTKDAQFEKIAELNPSHIVCCTEENSASLIARLKNEITFKTCETHTKNVFEVEHLYAQFQNFFEVNTKKFANDVKNALEKISALQKNKPQPIFLFWYFIWKNPWMLAGNKTYISSLLELFGWKNAIETSEELAKRYPSVPNLEELKKKQLQHGRQLALFSSEPYPFRNRHISEFQSEICDAQIVCRKIDGRLLSWYGASTVSALEYLWKFSQQVEKNELQI